jgi:hypothetical protein
MTTASSNTPFFCADCDRELTTATGASRQRDGRTICGTCQKKLDDKKKRDAQPDLFIEQNRLFNPRRRRNVAGYNDGSGFHPIRGSKGYNEFLAGDFEPRKRESAKRERERKEWERQELRKRLAMMQAYQSGR